MYSLSAPPRGRLVVVAEKMPSKRTKRASRSRKAKAATKQQPAVSETAEESSTTADAEARKAADEKRVAVAAKISAARALARKLATQQQASVARANGNKALNEEELEAIKRSVEESSAAAAKEAAAAGAKVRQTNKAAAITSEQLGKLARLKEENEALQQLVLEVAANKDDARKRVLSLKERFNDLVKEIAKGQQLLGGVKLKAAQQAVAKAAKEAVAATPEKKAEIMETADTLTEAHQALSKEEKRQDESAPEPAAVKEEQQAEADEKAEAKAAEETEASAAVAEPAGAEAEEKSSEEKPAEKAEPEAAAADQKEEEAASKQPAEEESASPVATAEPEAEEQPAAVAAPAEEQQLEQPPEAQSGATSAAEEKAEDLAERIASVVADASTATQEEIAEAPREEQEERARQQPAEIESAAAPEAQEEQEREEIPHFVAEPVGEQQQQQEAAEAREEAYARNVESLERRFAQFVAGTETQQGEQRSSDSTTAEEPRVDVKRLAKQAYDVGQQVFYVPQGGIPVGSSGTLYYNAAKTVLPENRRLLMKAGINKWQDIVVLDMRRSDELGGMYGCDWWCIDLYFDEDVFQVEFVVVEANSGAVDNNRGKDFQVRLLGALTQDEILERQAAALAEFEQMRLELLDAEEERIWRDRQEAAYKEADASREQFRIQFEELLWGEAADAATDRRRQISGLKTQPSWDNLLVWERHPVAGQPAILLYNKSQGALRDANGVLMHLGFDGWLSGTTREVQMTPLSPVECKQLRLSEKGSWWRAALDVPDIAMVMDCVFSDPGKWSWDNNRKQDFHIPIQKALNREQLIEYFFNEAWNLRQGQLIDGQDGAAKRTIRKMEEKAKAERRRRELQRQIFFTMPPTPVAGEDIDLFYNPDITALRGRPEIWVRGSFNRWSHGERFGPVQMQPVVRGGAGFHRATIKVPSDAWNMDFVVSDSPDGGAFYDNNNGMDYHIDVTNSTKQRPRLHVVHVAVEMAPIAKVGGMADVVTALGRACMEAGHDVKVILPKYDVIDYGAVKGIHQSGSFWWNNTEVKVWEGEVEELHTIFLEPCNGTVWAGCIYGRRDDAARFGFFCGAALNYLKHHAPQLPDIVHAHDWQSAPCLLGDLHPARGVFTIHNMEFGVDQIGRAMAAASVATTVSPTYAAEVSGHPAIAPHLGKFYGVRNGIDQDIWDPLFDRFLPRGYSAENAREGKAAAKDELRRRMELSSADVPLVSVVTRLTHQKGIHLIKHAAWRTLERGGQFVLLGSAPDARVQGEFNALAGDIARQYPDRARFWFAYDEPLSHLIYAGSDLFLVPSMFEPCGLTQMIAMRYGTVPVVRKTGGLNDTVFDVDDDVNRAHAAGMEPNGFSFVGADAAGLDYALNRALEVWYTNKRFWNILVQRVMQQDWSWAEPAQDYCEIYYKALKD